MARLLILGGGCRGLRLAEDALRQGHAVRVVTRAETNRGPIEATGAECWVGDPDRLGTLRGALEGVTIACWLLGSATGPEAQLRALHGDRLRSFVGHMVDTTVRGFLYEAVGTVPAGILAEGERTVRALGRRNAIPTALLTAAPGDAEGWLAGAHAAVAALLGASRGALSWSQ